MSMARFKVTLTMDYQLPNDLQERVEAYGTADPAECFAFDFANDPASTLLEDGDIEVLRVEAVPHGS